MNDTVLKIALAALMHDMGKMAEGGMDLSPEYVDSNQNIYQPSWDGRPSHRHALYTAAFIEHYSEHLPAVCNQSDWGDGERLDSFINLAACHHKPETPMQWCITVADRLSSGLDRDTFKDDNAVSFKDYRSTRLLSVLEALSPEPDMQTRYESSDNYKTNYPLRPLSAESIFPTDRAKQPKSTDKEEYQKLFDQFITALSNLPHAADNIRLWAEHFDSLFSTYCSQIPAARVGKVVPDVSLYDHCRTTAALAVPLYLYHQTTDTLTEKEIKKNTAEKFLLISGDFYGIQDFIFSSGGEQQRLRAKLLRGRSFAVSLFSELAADTICTALDIPFTAVFLNAAGKFHILTANTPSARQTIENEKTKLNDWLLGISYGQASLGITVTPASPAQFTNGKFTALWDSHMRNMDGRKYERLPIQQYGVVNDFLNQFNSDLNKALCPFCGKRPSSRAAEKDSWIDNKGSACTICRDHIMLGSNLVKGLSVGVFSNEIKASKRESLLAPLFDRYQIKFLNKSSSTQGADLIKLWQLQANRDGSLPNTGTLRLINGYVPVYRESDRDNISLQAIHTADDDLRTLDDIIASQDMPKTFNALAALAKEDHRGTAALGVLKADVDNLGLLMSCGMADSRITLSRMATLSRRLDQFFSLYLPYLLGSEETFQDVYTVFAGGDDLFLIGPWNKMAKLAMRLRREWGRYVSGNDQDKHLTFSAGITLHKTHVPVDRLACTAELALEAAKDNDRNSMTMFGETVKWDEFEKLQHKQRDMESWVDDGYISKAMLYRMNIFIEMAGKAKRITSENQAVHMRDMECLKWPALFKYSLERNIRKKGREREAALREVAVMAEWLEKYGSALRVPLWSHLYEQR